MYHIQIKFVSPILLFGCLCFLVLSCQRESEKDQNPAMVPVPVITALVSHDLVQRPVPCSGVVYPVRQERLSFLAGGRIADIHRLKGKRAAKGESLASLEREPLTRAWVRTGLDLIAARSKLYRMEKLLEEGKVSQAEYQEEERRTSILREIYFQAKADRQRADLIAPFNGRVLSWLVSPGDSVAVGQTVVLFGEVDPRALAKANLSEADFYRIQVGDSALVVPRDVMGLPLAGRVESKGLAESVAGQPFTVDILFENPGGAVGVGTEVNVTISTKFQQRVVLIPKDALIDRQDDDASVFLTDPKGKFAVRRHVVLGPDLGNNVIVDKGLFGGERLIVHGQDLLKDGARIVLMGSQK